MTILPAVIAAVFLADALNCVVQGHADWWVPASLAFINAALIRRPEQSTRGAK